MHECPSSPTAIDIAFRACQEECEYCATFRVNPRALGERTAEYYVDHACVTVRFRGRVPSAEDDARAVALDAIGFDHSFVVLRHGGAEAASNSELARIATACWFDHFGKATSAITLAIARSVEVVAEAGRLALSRVAGMSPLEAGVRLRETGVPLHAPGKRHLRDLAPSAVFGASEPKTCEC